MKITVMKHQKTKFKPLDSKNLNGLNLRVAIPDDATFQEQRRLATRANRATSIFFTC